MDREKRLTKRERKTIFGKGPSGTAPARASDPTATAGAPQAGSHIHCVACGKHLDTVGEIRARAAAGINSDLWATVSCLHGSQFYACFNCVPQAKTLLDEHDRTGKQVKMASPWH